MPGTPFRLDEYLITVGKLIHNGAMTESLLFAAFCILSRCEPEMAGTIFYSLDAFQAKKGLLKRVAAASGDAEDREIVDGIIAAAEKSNNQRQHVSHAILSQIINPKELRLWRPKTNIKVPVTKEYMDDLMKNSSDAQTEASEAFQNLYRKHGGLPKKDDVEKTSEHHP